MVVSGGEGFRAFLVDTRTGEPAIGELPGLAPSWGLRLNAAGTISLSLKPRSVEAAGMDIRNATTPNFRSLGIAYNGQVLECGPILNRSYKHDTGTMTLTAAGLWSVFARRKAMTGAALASSYPVMRSFLKIGPTSYGSIARELVRVSIQDNPYNAAYGALNVALPAVVAGTHIRTYQAHEMIWIADALTNLTETEYGPDIRFRPRFMSTDDTRVEWVLETGSDTNPFLRYAGSPIMLDGTAPDSPVVGFDSDEDGTEVAARAWRIGGGQEKDRRVGMGTVTTQLAAGMPWMEMERSSGEEMNMATLNTQARGDLREHQAPLVTFSLTARTDHPSAPLGSYLPGDFADVIIPEDHPTLNPGKQQVRIMAIDGDVTNKVKLTVAPFQGSYLGPTTTETTHILEG